MKYSPLRALLSTAAALLPLAAFLCLADSGLAGNPPPAARAFSPYTDDGYQVRGQVHAHSLPDDCRIGSALTRCQFYRNYWVLGYYFFAMTNHNIMSDFSGGYYAGCCPPPAPVNHPWPVPGSVEITYGSLARRDGHLIVLGADAGTTVDQLAYDSDGTIVERMKERIRRAHAHGALAFIAHPSAVSPTGRYWITPNELAQICRAERPDAVSIYHISANTEWKWDYLLWQCDQPIWGYSEDDYHPDVLSSRLAGSTWVQVPITDFPFDPWNAYLKQRMRDGDFYVCWVNRGSYDSGTFLRGPTLRVSVNSLGNYPVISAQVGDTNGCSYTTRFKTIRGVYQGSQYTCTGLEKYVRVQAEVYLGFGRRIEIRSQPIWIDPVDTVGTVVRTLAARGTVSTSPGLRLRYLSSSERPAPPDGGYIGHAFDVTTQDGQVSQGAVLDLSYDGEDLSAIGGTGYLAIYRYDASALKWAKLGGTVNPAAAVASSPITALGYYTISADLPVDTAAPAVSITSPLSGGTVGTDTEVRATVRDSLGACTVSFYMNGHPLAEDADATDGWSAPLPCADYCEGDWTLRAVAEDLAGNQGTAEVPIHIRSSTPRPTVTITSLAEGATLSGAVTVAGTCWDDVAVAQVALYAGDTLVGAGDLDGSGGWSCSVDTTLIANGVRLLRAVVEDDPGNEASASVSVTVNNPGAWRGLAMVSLPVTPGSADPKQVVAFQGNSWFSYRPDVGRYGVYPDHSTWFEPVEKTPGRGFWSRFAGESPRAVGLAPPQDQPAVIHLLAGWNMIGTPFLSGVKWRLSEVAVQVAGGSSKPLGDSRDAVYPYLWGWRQNEADPLRGSYYLIYDSSAMPGVADTLEPWKAYWIRARKECDLILPPP